MGAEQQDRDQQRIGGDLAPARRQVARGERLDHAHDQPAQQRTRKAAEPADHGGGKGLDPDETGRRIQRPLRGVKDTGNRGHDARQCPDHALNALDRNAHVIGRHLVLTGRLHGQAHLGALEKLPQQEGHDQGHDDHGDIGQTQNQLADADIAQRQRRAQRLRLMPPDFAHGKPDHEAQRDGHDDHRHLTLPEDGPQHHDIQQIAQHAHDQKDQRQRQPEGDARIFRIDQPEGDEGAQHHEIALREIHGLRRLVDQNEAKRDQAIDTAIRKPADQKLQNLHAILPVLRPRLLRWVPRLCAVRFGPCADPSPQGPKPGSGAM